MKIFAFPLLLLATGAIAQTEVESMWNFVDPTSAKTITVTPFDGTTGTAVEMPTFIQNMSFTNLQTVIPTVFPASTVAYKLVGFRISFSATGVGIVPRQPFIFDVPVPALLVPAGLTLKATLTAPLSGLANIVLSLGPDSVVPSAPRSLVATASSTSAVVLSWAAATDNVGVSGYSVERCVGDVTACAIFAQIGVVGSTVFSDSALAPGQAYSYRVRASDVAGNTGVYSNVASATTLVPAPPPPVLIVSPDGTQMPPATQIIEANGNIWTFAPATGSDAVKGQISVLVKRPVDPKPVQVRASVNFVLWKGAIYNFDPLAPTGSGNCSTAWEKWGGNSWACSPAPAGF